MKGASIKYHLGNNKMHVASETSDWTLYGNVSSGLGLGSSLLRCVYVYYYVGLKGFLTL